MSSPHEPPMSESLFTPRDLSKREGEESFQDDWDLAWDAAHALERATSDPDSPIKTSTFTKVTEETEKPKETFAKLKQLFDRLRGGPQRRQENLALFLEATEREARRERLDGLCGEFGVFDQAGIESIARIEALKMKNNRPGAAQGFAVALVDIDGLGVINDTLGHETGNELIAGIGREISQTVRETDFVGRSKGDEFVILLPIGDEETARTIMEIQARNRSGEVEPGVIKKLLSRAEGFRMLLKARLGGRYPKDDSERVKGKYPGDISVGWSFLSKEQYLQKYEEYEKVRRTGKSLVEILTRDADEEMYKMKRGKASAEAPTEATPPDLDGPQ